MSNTLDAPARRRGARSPWRSAALVAVGLLTVTSLGACRNPGGGGTPTTPVPTTGNPGQTTRPPTTQQPPSGGSTQTVTSTIKVSGTFDGGGKRYRGGGALGSGGDGEGKDPIFQLAPGSTISNLIIGAPASDGIHCLGTCTIRNVVWEDVLDDAATLKGTNPSDVMTIDGGKASHASDKVFQHNGPGRVVIKNFTVEDFGKLYRSCGNCSNNNTVRGQGGRHVVIDNVTVIGPGKTLAGINSNYGDTAQIGRVTIRNDSSRKIALCERYTGNSSGAEPSKNGTGAGGGCTIPGPVTYQ